MLMLALPATALIGSFSACSDSQLGELFITPSDSLTTLTIIDVMENRELSKADYTLWIELLKKANYYNALKNANAKATVFCPNNEAMIQFLKERNVSSVEELDEEYAKAVVMSHIVADEAIESNDLVDRAIAGRNFDKKNLYDADLTLSYGCKMSDCDDNDPLRNTPVGSADSIYFNNQVQARLGVYEGLTCKNGIFYQMDGVIQPNAECIYSRLKNDGGYNIFAEAMAECKYDSIADRYSDTIIALGGKKNIVPRAYTCFAVADSTYNRFGINNVEDLKEYISKNTSEGLASDLFSYMQYHFLKREYLASELFTFQNPDDTNIFEVRLPGQCMITNNDGVANFINNDVPVFRSDIQARNGHINKIGSVMAAYAPEPVNVKWDFLNEEDIIAFVNNYGNSKSLGEGNLFRFPLESSPTEYKIDLSEAYKDGNYGNISSFTYKIESTKSSTTNYRNIGFYKDKYFNATNKGRSQYCPQRTSQTMVKAGTVLLNNGTTKQVAVGETVANAYTVYEGYPEATLYQNNYLCLNIGYGGYVKFNTPSIIRGKYKVVLHYLTDAGTQNTLFSSGTNTRFQLDAGTDNELSTTKPLYKGVTYTRASANQGLTLQLWGEVEFTATENHTLTIVMMDLQAKNLGNYHLYLDYIEFIPVN